MTGKRRFVDANFICLCRRFNRHEIGTELFCVLADSTSEPNDQEMEKGFPIMVPRLRRFAESRDIKEIWKLEVVEEFLKEEARGALPKKRG